MRPSTLTLALLSVSVSGIFGANSGSSETGCSQYHACGGCYDTSGCIWNPRLSACSTNINLCIGSGGVDECYGSTPIWNVPCGALPTEKEAQAGKEEAGQEEGEGERVPHPECDQRTCPVHFSQSSLSCREEEEGVSCFQMTQIRIGDKEDPAPYCEDNVYCRLCSTEQEGLECTEWFDGCNTRQCPTPGMMGNLVHQEQFCQVLERAKCLKAKEVKEEVKEDDNLVQEHEKICPSGCLSWFDGCRQCACLGEGRVGKCTQTRCANPKPEAARCNLYHRTSLE